MIEFTNIQTDDSVNISERVSVWCRGDPEMVAVPKFGENVKIFDNVRIVLCENNGKDDSFLEIGDGTYINYGSFLSGEGGLKIGKNVLVGPYVVFATAGHKIDSNEPIYTSGIVTKPISVDDGAWIGAHSTIIGGSTIGKESVVAAGSVVKGFVPPFSVVAGNPARIVKYRNGATYVPLIHRIKIMFRIKIKLS